MDLEYFDFQNLIKNLNDGLYLVDKNRKILFWNDMAEKITGFSTTQVIGSHCYDNILIHIDAKGRKICAGLCPLAHTINDGTPRTADVFLHHREGHRIPVTIRTTPFTRPYDIFGRWGGEEFLGIIRNIDQDTKNI